MRRIFEDAQIDTHSIQSHMLMNYLQNKSLTMILKLNLNANLDCFRILIKAVLQF